MPSENKRFKRRKNLRQWITRIKQPISLSLSLFLSFFLSFCLSFSFFLPSSSLISLDRVAPRALHRLQKTAPLNAVRVGADSKMTASLIRADPVHSSRRNCFFFQLLSNRSSIVPWSFAYYSLDIHRSIGRSETIHFVFVHSSSNALIWNTSSNSPS